MAWPRHALRSWHPAPGFQTRNHDLVPIATPGSRDIYYPGHQPFAPFGFGGPHLIPRNPYRAADPTGQRGLESLKDKTLESAGDLGWTPDYATAWLYRHLNNSRTDVAEAIDAMRDTFDVVRFNEAYLIFDVLDATIFGQKLKGMVYLMWIMQPNCSPGKTSAPNVVPGIPRICIQLNSALFDDGLGDIDELLEVLIHQMIHAYFLVCCGAQRRGDKVDGRLEDGKHFAVILMAVRSISKECEDGELELIFHASKRRQRDIGLAPGQVPASHALVRRGLRDPYLAINPAGDNPGLGLVMNQTNCMRDNRHITPGDVQNWQMIDFSRSLELDMEAKGEKIWECAEDGKLVEVERIKCPPSVTYIEMLWDDKGEIKRVMAKREKALNFKSLERPLLKHDRYELKIPECTRFETFKCIYDFINKEAYCATPLEKLHRQPVNQGKGPPVLHREHTYGMPAPPDKSILTHVRVFKAAEGMKFVELIQYAIAHMWNVPWTSEDPIELLEELYNLEQEPTPAPINAELHRWARSFLAARERGGPNSSLSYRSPRHDMLQYHHPHGSRYMGLSNLQKIGRWYPEECRTLLHRSQAFRDDLQHARLMIRSGTANLFARPAFAAGAVTTRQRLIRDTAVAPLAIADIPHFGEVLGHDIDIEAGPFILNEHLGGGRLGGLGGLDDLRPTIINPLGGMGSGAGVPLGSNMRGPGLDPYMPL